MLLEVVVVTHNSWEPLAALTRSLWPAELDSDASPATNLLIVDAGSEDIEPLIGVGARRLLRSANYGFGSCANLGVGASDAEWIALLNPDCEVKFDDLVRAVRWLKERSAVIGGTAIADKKGRKLINPIDSPRGLSRLRRNSVAWKSLRGAIILLHRQTFLSVGGFDTNFFLYGEELDLCLRYQKLGHSLDVCQDISVVHHEETGSGNISTWWRMAQRFRGKSQFLAKHYGKLNARSTLLLDIVTFSLRLRRPLPVWQFVRAALLDERRALPYPASYSEYTS